MTSIVTNDDFEIDLDLFENDIGMNKTKTSIKISKKSIKISKKSDELFGETGYGKEMERKLVNNEMGNNGILTDENIKNIEHTIRKRGREAAEAAGMKDKKYMKELYSKARMIKMESKKSDKERAGGSRKARKQRRTKKRKNNRRRSTRRQKK